MFQSPVGRAVGIGWVNEFLARLEHRFPDTTNTQANRTLDNNPTTFPLDQSLYFDFSHISTMTSVLTALGLKRFAPLLPTSGKSCEQQKSPSTSNIAGVGPPANQKLVCSYIQPNAGRFDFEIISTPHPVPADRSNTTSGYVTGGPTKYVHLLINQVSYLALSSKEVEGIVGVLIQFLSANAFLRRKSAGLWKKR